MCEWNGALPPLSNPFSDILEGHFAQPQTSSFNLKIGHKFSMFSIIIGGFCLQPDAAPGCDSGLASDDADLVLMSSSELGDDDKWMTSTTFDRYLYKLEAEQNRQGCQLGIF